MASKKSDEPDNTVSGGRRGSRGSSKLASANRTKNLPGSSQTAAELEAKIQTLRTQYEKALHRLSLVKGQLANQTSTATELRMEADALRRRAIELEVALKVRNREFDQLIRDNQALTEQKLMASVEAADRIEAQIARLASIMQPTVEPATQPTNQPAMQAPVAVTAEPRRRWLGGLRRLFSGRTKGAGLAARADALAQCALFDGAWYLSENPDVRKVGSDPLTHYLMTGSAEGRDPHPLFDTEWYIGQLEPVTVPALSYLEHYLNKGASSGLSPQPLFDAAWYLAQNPDVAASGQAPLDHFVSSGWREGRSPHPLFEVSAFLEKHPEMLKGNTDPVSHYLQNWDKTHINPSPKFDARWYLETNIDVMECGMNPLRHYVTSGQFEGRLPRPGTGSREQGSASPSARPDRAAGQPSPLPDLFELRSGNALARCAVVVQMTTQSDACIAAAWLAMIECDFDLFVLAAPHLLTELEECVTLPHRKRLEVIESHDAPHEGFLFSHLVNNRILDAYEIVGWLNEAARLPKPFAPFDPLSFASQDPDFGIVCSISASVGSLSVAPELLRRLNIASARIGRATPPADAPAPDCPLFWINALLFRHVAACRLAPHELHFSAPGPRPNQINGGRELLALLFAAASFDGGFTVREYYG
jgi:hypothetical protein